tara:strand:+ start:2584 stop:3228 length:645 start_codon:yes stop_codon:yes gene_type:complete
MSELTAVLLRDCPHNSTATDDDNARFILQCDNFAVQIARTPIQMPIPGQSPTLMDFGVFRPSISISGLVENQGRSAVVDSAGTFSSDAASKAYYAFLQHAPFSRREGSDTIRTNNYYFPTKNILEEAAYKWKSLPGSEIELEIADASVPRYNTWTDGTAITGGDLQNVKPTGGGVYKVSIQQARFQVDAAKEDRWTFQMQFVARGRFDIGGIGN